MPMLVNAIPQAVFDAADPLAAPFPAPWGAGLDPLQRLMLLRCARLLSVAVGPLRPPLARPSPDAQAS
jgi:hypothetical protein